MDIVANLKGRRSVIGIVGLGYVGLPLVLRYCEVGFKVIGFDVDSDKISRLNAGQSYIEHISSAAIEQAIDAGFVATAEFSSIREADAIILCVPTPLNAHREPDLSYVMDTATTVAAHMRKGQILSLESTTYPGTTDEQLAPLLVERGFEIGRDVFLVYSPEREDPGNEKYSTRSIPKICGGHTQACLEAGMALYGEVIDCVVAVSSTRAAELTKLLENIHRAVNIGLVNEMKIVADKMDIDIHEVINAAATKPFGFVAYYPGPGLGGHCIPIDPYYLTWKAREYGVNTRFIELAGEVNSAMPDYVVEKISLALNDRRKCVNGSRVLVLGIAYKANVDDMRESPSVIIMDKLRQLGADISYSDPHIPKFPKVRHHSFDLESIDLTPETLSDFDCILLATDHEEFDFDMIRNHAQLIVDARGRYLAPAAHIVKA